MSCPECEKKYKQIKVLEEMAENYKVCYDRRMEKMDTMYYALAKIRGITNEFFKEHDAVQEELKKYTGENA